MARNTRVACDEFHCCVCGQDYQDCTLDGAGGLATGHAVIVGGKLICVRCTKAAVQWFAEVHAEGLRIARAASDRR